MSGLFCWIAWPVSPMTFFIFFAFVPLLFVAGAIKKRTSFFGYSFITLLIWNASTTWWMWNSTDIGSIAAIAANSLIMCLPWWGYHSVKNKFSQPISYTALITFWMLFEYVHLNWQLSWPWLTLGNVFASHPDWVQWYEYTGVSGGTLWVLLMNVLVFEVVSKIKREKIKLKIITTGLAVLIVPFLFSIYCSSEVTINNTLNSAAPTENVLIVQPNIDPYQKFETSSISQQIQKLVALSEQNIDTNTQLILWPETAMSADDEEKNTPLNIYYQPVFQFLQRHPNVTLLSGLEAYKMYGRDKETATARATNDGLYYDAFNAAVFAKANAPFSYYHKMKLVPGVESLPTFLNFMAPVFEKFGGSTGGYGRDTGAVVFKTPGNLYAVAPVICYESIYGEHVTDYVKKGANLIGVITNDGWWGNTPGYKQHLQYARLRAIETRRWIARSANTGISAVINDKGQILETQPWNVAAVIKYSIPIMSKQTFYVRFGDYLYRAASLLGILILIMNITMLIRNKFSRH